MHHFSAVATQVAILLIWPQAASAQETVLTLDEVLQVARAKAPGIVSARSRVGEAHGRLVGASVWLRENPVFEASGGRRFSAQRGFIDGDVGLSQTLELGGRRGARMEAAEAGVTQAEALSQDAERRLVRDVSSAFFRVLFAEDRVQLARTSEAVSAEILRIAQRRLEAGDIPRLDVNLAQGALSRTRSERRAAEAQQVTALGELRILLGLDAEEPLAVAGDLKDRQRYAPSDRIAQAPERADVRALGAERTEADAAARLGRSLAWPTLGLGVRYEREEEANTVLGTLTLSLPAFERGQGLQAEAAARSRRLGLELESSRKVVRVEMRTAMEAYRRRVEAVVELETSALPLLDGNEALARRSYEAGQLGLADLLVVRREIVGTRLDYLDRLLEAALAGVELEASAGVLR